MECAGRAKGDAALDCFPAREFTPHAKTHCGNETTAIPKRRRRFALPAHSKGAVAGLMSQYHCVSRSVQWKM